MSATNSVPAGTATVETKERYAGPVVRYRVLAAIFFILAAGGLFLGYLGTKFSGVPVIKWFQHINVVLYNNPGLNQTGVSLIGGELVSNTLFGYIYSMCKLFFSSGWLIFRGELIPMTIEFLGVAQVMFVALSVVLSLAFMIASFCTRKAARGLSIASAVFVSIAYLWLAATVFFVRVQSGLGIKASIDVPLAAIAGLSLLILAITAMARRKLRGFLNVLLLILVGAAMIGLIYPGSDALGRVIGVFDGSVSYQDELLAFTGVMVLEVFLAINAVFALIRMNSNKGYGFDVFRYTLLLAAGIWFFVQPMLAPGGIDNFTALFKGTPNLISSILILAGVVIAFILSIGNAVATKHIREEEEFGELSNQYDPNNPVPVVVVGGNLSTPAPAPAPAPAPVTKSDEATPLRYTPVVYGEMENVEEEDKSKKKKKQVVVDDDDDEDDVPVRPAPVAAPAPAPAPVYPQYPQYPPYPQYPQMMPPYPYYGMPYMPPQQPSFMVLQVPNAQAPAAPAQPQQSVQPQRIVRRSPAMAATTAPLSDFERRMQSFVNEGKQEEAVNAANAAPALASSPAPAPAPKPVSYPAWQPTAGGQPVTAPERGYPYDVFMSTLSAEEKEQFCALFIDCVYGNMGVPVYVPGEANKEFFKKVFVNLGKFRDHASVGLLTKLSNYIRTNG